MQATQENRVKRRMAMPTLLAILALGLRLPAAAAGTQVVHAADCVVDAETFHLPACATERRHGELYVRSPFVRAFFLLEPYRRVYAHLEGEEGWAYFDRTGRILVHHVATMDNGADEPRHGTVRVTAGGKWGLATISGRALTPLRYDGMVYAEHGFSACLGCHSATEGEHSVFVEGTWTELGFDGKPLAEPGAR